MRKIALILTLIATLLVLTACGNNPNKKLIKNIEANQLDIPTSDIKILSTTNHPDNENYEVVLFRSKDAHETDSYYIYAVDSVNNKMIPFEYGDYTPLNIIIDACFDKLSEEQQIKNFDIISEFIKENGFNCFENALNANTQKQNKENAKNYIRQVTDIYNGAIPAEEAKNAIESSLSSILYNIENADNPIVIFEPDNANPMYYAYENTTLTYRWQRFYDEKTYRVWESVTDRQTKELMIALYGSPYELETRWIAVDDDLKVTDYFETKESAIKTLSLKLPRATAASKPTTSQKSISTPAPSPVTSDDILYRVRIDADRADTQIGAYRVLENAKKIADEHKYEGYKVFDQNGNLIYTP